MKFRGRQKARPPLTGNPVGDLRRELEAADAERADAVRARQDLEDGRDDVLASEDVAELEAHETAVAAVERRVAVANTKCDRLTAEVEAAEAAAVQARRRASYDEGVAAITKARRIIASEYLPAARALADIVNRAVASQRTALDANADLPEGVEPIDLMLEPEFNGRYYGGLVGLSEEREYFVNRQTGERAGQHDAPQMHANRGRWERRTETVERSVPAMPAEGHKSVADFLNLPGFDAGSYAYAAPRWGQPRT